MSNICIFEIKRGMTIVCNDGKEYTVKEVQPSMFDDDCVVYVKGNKEIKLKDISHIKC